jgi:hypothetical protein
LLLARLARLALLPPLLLVAGCPKGDDPDACQLGFVGDPSAQPELEVVFLFPDGTLHTVVEGGQAPMIEPPQGGRVIFAGVRARNVDACAATLLGAVRDPGGHVVLDSRTINLQAQDGGTSGSTADEASTFANVPVCPNQWADRNLFDQDFTLEISLTDRKQRKASKSIRVRPYCAEPAKLDECLCICKHGYVLGEPCNADAGVGDGG